VLVAGPGIFICDECVELAKSVIDATQAKSSGSRSRPKEPDQTMKTYALFVDSRGSEKLLDGLVNIERTRKGIGKHQQLIVDSLRSKRIRWAEIGEVLGVTRQAAWQRFGASD